MGGALAGSSMWGIVMKKTILAVSAATLAISSLAAPLSAQDAGEETFSLLAAAANEEPSTIDPMYGTNPDLDKACADALNANGHSGFRTFAENVTTMVGSPVTVDDGPTTTTGIGMVVFTMTGYRDAHVNGQSVNIHAFADLTATYPDGALESTPTKTTVTTTLTGRCHVHKATNGAMQEAIHPGFQIAPPGQQVDDDVTATTTMTTFGTRTNPIPGPFVDPTQTRMGSEFVICISPSAIIKKGVPGVWRGQNGYVSQLGRSCSTAWYNELNPAGTPSASLPAT